MKECKIPKYIPKWVKEKLEFKSRLDEIFHAWIEEQYPEFSGKFQMRLDLNYRTIVESFNSENPLLARIKKDLPKFKLDAGNHRIVEK